MPITKYGFRIAAACAGIVILALAVACHGFFTKPILQSINVSPSSSLVGQGSTQSLTAIGVFDDGSSDTLTSGVTWTSSDDTIATVDNNGVVTGVKAGGPATITATSGSASGTGTVTVTSSQLVSIAVTPATATISASFGTSATFTATGTFQQGSTQDITNNVQWSATPANVVNFSNVSTVTAVSGLATTQQVTITATSGGISGTATLLVSP